MTDPSKGSGLENPKPGPAQSFLTEQQHMTGALATGKSGSGTPAAGSSASSGSGGGAASAPPASSLEQTLQSLAEGITKMNTRLDKQGQFLHGLDGAIKQNRKDFEERYAPGKQTPPQTQGKPGQRDPDENPPPIDMGTLTDRVSSQVMGQMKEFLSPLVQQTRTNTAAHMIDQAQMDPAVAKMVQELPPQTRANLAHEAHRALGDRMFAEPDLLSDGPDPVKEYIELTHYRTVVKTGYKPEGDSPQTQQTQTQPTQGFSPVPTMGTQSVAPGSVHPHKEAAEELYGTSVGKMQYPAGVAADLARHGV